MRTHTLRVSAVAIAALTLLTPTSHAQTPEHPWPIRAVIVTTFEVGKDTGDIPGEFQFWVEREHLTETLPFPGGPIDAADPSGTHPIRTNAAHTILGIVSGTTLVNATASLMALGLDPRFDLTHAYILINGIAGVDPKIASIGSAVWANYVVNDVARQIDPREAPKDWPYGIFPSGALRPDPNAITETSWTRSNLYTLNPKLTTWAYEQTKNLSLGDDPKVAVFRSGFTNYPNARRPPFVLIGATFASDYYWHGAIMTQYARDWVRLYTKGQGTFTTTEMEDAGFLNAIERLNNMHRVDANRVLDLRSASNYSEERPGHAAAESITAPYIGGRLALESAYLCGSTVINKLLANWPTTYGHIPGD
jgi:purine nucleoside permease